MGTCMNAEIFQSLLNLRLHYLGLVRTNFIITFIIENLSVLVYKCWANVANVALLHYQHQINFFVSLIFPSHLSFPGVQPTSVSCASLPVLLHRPFLLPYYTYQIFSIHALYSQLLFFLHTNTFLLPILLWLCSFSLVRYYLCVYKISQICLQDITKVNKVQKKLSRNSYFFIYFVSISIIKYNSNYGNCPSVKNYQWKYILIYSYVLMWTGQDKNNWVYIFLKTYILYVIIHYVHE